MGIDRTVKNEDLLQTSSGIKEERVISKTLGLAIAVNYENFDRYTKGCSKEGLLFKQRVS